jgi:excisionase family DNA binding protein
LAGLRKELAIKDCRRLPLISSPRYGIKADAHARHGFVLQLEGCTMPVLEVKVVEPAALSPEGAGDYLSLTKRQIYNLIADGLLIAKRSGARTLVDFASVKNYYEGLPLKTVAASIPNSPQCAAFVRRRRSARAHAPSAAQI